MFEVVDGVVQARLGAFVGKAAWRRERGNPVSRVRTPGTPALAGGRPGALSAIWTLTLH